MASLIQVCVSAQSPVSARTLPQWLTGIIAVVGFLFLTFVIFLVKRAWCEKPKRERVRDEERQRVPTVKRLYNIHVYMDTWAHEAEHEAKDEAEREVGRLCVSPSCEP
uniref:Uncharacterized protein n=1 Tax=Periophthalmus magnuspinnatus TaxID=409849 RepID=A0A3B4BAM7_9GOBI